MSVERLDDRVSIYASASAFGCCGSWCRSEGAGAEAAVHSVNGAIGESLSSDVCVRYDVCWYFVRHVSPPVS